MEITSRNNEKARPCYWYGNRMVFHMWSYGTPFHYFSYGGTPKECTVAILEDEYGKIVNARPEDVHFLDSENLFDEVWEGKFRETERSD